MLEIRENKILFQYLENVSIYFSDDAGWSIQGESILGRTEIYLLSNEIIRITLPIMVPKFINLEILHKIVDNLNTSLEGVCTVSEEEGNLFIEYHIHTINTKESLDKGLLKFAIEKADILKGFSFLQKDFNNMKNQIKNHAMSILNNKEQDIVGSTDTNSQEVNMSNLWNEMDNIDKKQDEDEDEDKGETIK